MNESCCVPSKIAKKKNWYSKKSDMNWIFKKLVFVLNYMYTFYLAVKGPWIWFWKCAILIQFTGVVCQEDNWANCILLHLYI